MNEYNILKTIVLGFMTHNDSYEMIIKPGEGYLKFDGQDIIFVNNHGVELLSATTNNAIEIWLDQNTLEKKL